MERQPEENPKKIELVWQGLEVSIEAEQMTEKKALEILEGRRQPVRPPLGGTAEEVRNHIYQCIIQGQIGLDEGIRLWHDWLTEQKT